jgi:hypothetical protein
MAMPANGILTATVFDPLSKLLNYRRFCSGFCHLSIAASLGGIRFSDDGLLWLLA